MSIVLRITSILGNLCFGLCGIFFLGIAIYQFTLTDISWLIRCALLVIGVLFLPACATKLKICCLCGGSASLSRLQVRGADLVERVYRYHACPNDHVLPSWLPFFWLLSAVLGGVFLAKRDFLQVSDMVAALAMLSPLIVYFTWYLVESIRSLMA